MKTSPVLILAGFAVGIIVLFVAFQTARALGAAAYLHSLSGSPYQAWTPVSGKIVFPNGPPALNSSTVARLDLDVSDPNTDLNTASIVWDVEGETQLAVGRTFTLSPRTSIGEKLVEAEA